VLSYNVNGTSIKCVALDSLDEHYLYHHAMLSFTSQNIALCDILGRINSKLSSNLFQLERLYYKYHKIDHNEFKQKFLNTIRAAKDLKKEVSNNKYNFSNVKDLSVDFKSTIFELKNLYSECKTSIDSNFNPDYMFSRALSVSIIAGYAIDPTAMDNVYVIYAFLYGGASLYEDKVNNPDIIINEVADNIDAVIRLLGEFEDFDLIVK
jgi:hypothetical protein